MFVQDSWNPCCRRLLNALSQRWISDQLAENNFLTPVFLVTFKCYFTCLCSLGQTTGNQMIYYLINLLQDQSLPLGINRSSSRLIIASWHLLIFFKMDHCLSALIDPLQDRSLTLIIQSATKWYIIWSIFVKSNHCLLALINPLQDRSLTLGIDQFSSGGITASRHWSILCKIDHWLSSFIQIAFVQLKLLRIDHFVSFLVKAIILICFDSKCLIITAQCIKWYGQLSWYDHDKFRTLIPSGCVKASQMTHLCLVTNAQFLGKLVTWSWLLKWAELPQMTRFSAQMIIFWNEKTKF